jgi:HicB family
MTSILTIRVDQELAEMAKSRARHEGVSLNQYANDLLRAALDPGSAGGLVDSLRERLRRAGLLVPEPAVAPGKTDRPDPAVVAAAMAAAGRGTPLSEFVSTGRG